jgi:hypothetical protein
MIKREHGGQSAAHAICLSPISAHKIIRNALTEGRVQYGSHFRIRMGERNFDMLDVERVVKFGSVSGPGEHCAAFHNWRYRLSKKVDDHTLTLVIAIDEQEDLDALPLIILVTGYWCEKRTNDGEKQRKKKPGINRGKAIKAACSE